MAIPGRGRPTPPSSNRPTAPSKPAPQSPQQGKTPPAKPTANATAESYPDLGTTPFPPEHGGDEGGEMLVKSEQEEENMARRLLASLLPQAAIDAVNEAAQAGFEWAPIRDKLRRRNVHPTTLLSFEAQWELACEADGPTADESK